MKLFSVTILSGLLTCLNISKGFLISKVVALYAGPEGLAMMGQLQSFVAGINGLVTNQISQGVARFTAENKQGDDSPYRYWRASTKLLSLILFISLPFLMLFIDSFSIWLLGSGAYSWVFLLALLFLPLNICNSLLLSVVNGREEHLKYITTLMLSSIFSCLVSVFLIYQYGVIGGLISVAVNNGISGIIVIIRVYQEEWFSFKNWFGKTDKKKISIMSKYMALGIFGAVTGPISMIMIRNILTDNFSLEAAGQWQFVWGISSAFISVLTTAISVYYYPKLAQSVCKKKLNSETLKVLALIIPLVCGGAFIIYMLRFYIIDILATTEFYASADLFKVQLFGDVLRVAAFIPGLLLLAKGYFRVNILLEFIASANFTIFTYFLVNEFGLIGVSYAHIINYLIYGIIAWSMYFRHLASMEVLND